MVLMRPASFFLLAITVRASTAQPHVALPVDPRHHFDKRCPPAVSMDPTDLMRDPVSSSQYLDLPMQANVTAEDCARVCCGDWSCETFTFRQVAAVTGELSGSWYNHDSSSGVSRLAITQSGRHLLVQSLDLRYNWIGQVTDQKGYLCFDGDVLRNRTFNTSSDGNTLFMSHLKGDPKGYSQASLSAGLCMCVTCL